MLKQFTSNTQKKSKAKKIVEAVYLKHTLLNEKLRVWLLPKHLKHIFLANEFCEVKEINRKGKGRKVEAEKVSMDAASLLLGFLLS